MCLPILLLLLLLAAGRGWGGQTGRWRTLCIYEALIGMGLMCPSFDCPPCMPRGFPICPSRSCSPFLPLTLHRDLSRVCAACSCHAALGGFLRWCSWYVGAYHRWLLHTIGGYCIP